MDHADAAQTRAALLGAGDAWRCLAMLCCDPWRGHSATAVATLEATLATAACALPCRLLAAPPAATGGRPGPLRTARAPAAGRAWAGVLVAHKPRGPPRTGRLSQYTYLIGCPPHDACALRAYMAGKFPVIMTDTSRGLASCRRRRLEAIATAILATRERLPVIKSSGSPAAPSCPPPPGVVAAPIRTSSAAEVL